ncbi:membrane protein insertion efficiency factor YidD [Flavobacteriaceae bacterium]|nr:membrane protein insertion efficiency factor YidD [Flavobacteriaceae bacterium]
MDKIIKSLINAPFLFLIFLYQKLLSPILGPKCRFTPTCSQYTAEALKKYGPFKGIWISSIRILKCHPWGGKGYDPVP